MNKPVAYIDPYDFERLPNYDCHIGSQQLKNGIPLYTHPVKELTQSEFENIFDACYIGDDYNTQYDFKQMLELINQAILRKASEK